MQLFRNIQTPRYLLITLLTSLAYMDGQWMEVVLGGTFKKNAHDLMKRPETIQHIVRFWLDFFHQAPVDEDDIVRRDALINNILDKVTTGFTVDK